MEKFRKANEREKISAAIIVIIAAGALMCDFGIIRPFEFLVHKICAEEDLLFTLFGVQASVSTLSIALISIITGYINEVIYGISVSKFISETIPVIFKHKRIIIVSIILIPLNYICIAFKLFNLSVAVLMVSVVLTLVMVQNTYEIVLGKRYIKERIRSHIINNVDKVILEDLQQEILLAAETGSSHIIKDDFDLLATIVEKEVKNNNSETEIIKNISQLFIEVFGKIAYQHNAIKSYYCIELLNRLYEIAGKNSTVVNLSIWEQIPREFWTAVEDINTESIDDDFIFYGLRWCLYKNLEGKTTDKIESSDLKFFSLRLYKGLFLKKRNLSDEQRKRFKDLICENVLSSLAYNEENDDIKKIELLDLCYLNKILIENGDVLALRRFFDSCSDSNNENEKLAFLIAVIYLYYIICREELAKDKPIQENAKKVWEAYKRDIQYFYNHMYVTPLLEKNYLFICSLIDRWEYWGEVNAKTMITGSVIDDFFTFTAICSFWEDEQISKVLDVVSHNSIFTLYNRYFNDENMTRGKTLYRDYIKLFAKDEGEKALTDELLRIKEIFNQRYRKELQVEAVNHDIKSEALDKIKLLVNKEFTDIADKNLAEFKVKSNENINIKNNIPVGMYPMPYHLFEEERFDGYYLKDLHNKIIFTFLRIYHDNIIFKKLKYTNRNKQEHLISLVNDNNISPNIVIGQERKFWNEEDKDVLSKFTQNMERIDFPNGHNYCFMLDGSKIEFEYSNVRVEFEDLTWEQIEERYCKKTEDGAILFNVTNDIYIPLEKSEIIDYINKTEKLLKIDVDVKYKAPNEMIGAGIQIVYKDEEDDEE